MHSWKDKLVDMKKIEANYGSELRRTASVLKISEMKDNKIRLFLKVNI